MRRLLLITLTLTLLAGCAATRQQQRRGPSEVQRVLDQALMLMGETRLRVGDKPYRADCSGYVTAAYDAASVRLIEPGVEGDSGTELMFRSLKARGRIHKSKTPLPGDLAFFHNTWDRNGNKVRDDRFSHVALVESVADDGTIRLLHFASGKVKRDVMNLRHPDVARDPDTGKTWNSYLRRGGGKVLTGQLFYRFGRPLPQ